MGTILEDVAKGAEWMAQNLKSQGYKADFSLKSLREVDRFLDANSANGKATGGGFLAEQLGKRIFVLGAYVGEVLRRCIGGHWHGNDADPRADINVELTLPDGTASWPVQRVMKRFQNGKMDSIAAYGQEIASGIRTAPIRRGKKKPWWKFW